MSLSHVWPWYNDGSTLGSIYGCYTSLDLRPGLHLGLPWGYLWIYLWVYPGVPMDDLLAPAPASTVNPIQEPACVCPWNPCLDLPMVLPLYLPRTYEPAVVPGLCRLESCPCVRGVNVPLFSAK